MFFLFKNHRSSLSSGGITVCLDKWSKVIDQNGTEFGNRNEIGNIFTLIFVTEAVNRSLLTQRRYVDRYIHIIKLPFECYVSCGNSHRRGIRSALETLLPREVFVFACGTKFSFLFGCSDVQ